MRLPRSVLRCAPHVLELGACVLAHSLPLTNMSLFDFPRLRVVELLQHGVKPHKMDFTLKAKKNIIDFIEKSDDNQWKWIESKAEGISFFSNEGRN